MTLSTEVRVTAKGDTQSPHHPHNLRLARDQRAYVAPERRINACTLYWVTDGNVSILAYDLADAKRRVFVHNHLAGFDVDPEDLRTDGGM